VKIILQNAQTLLLFTKIIQSESIDKRFIHRIGSSRSTKSDEREPKSWLGWLFNSKIGRFSYKTHKMPSIQTATSRAKNSGLDRTCLQGPIL
jgi:hypothetical protein